MQRQKNQKIVIIASLVLLAVGLPVILIFGNNFSEAHYKIVFTIFIVSVVLERVWETFLTSKDKQKIQSTDDWTISAVVYYYILMILCVALEYFLVEKEISRVCVLAGGVILALSFALRWWSMKTLGDQWKIYVAGGSGVGNTRRLVRAGPYRFVRHPIYVGVIMELVAIPLMANTFWTLAFACAVNIPLQIFRSEFEEHYLFTYFANEYVRYKNEIRGFVPVFNRKSSNGSESKRSVVRLVDFKDRRGRK